MYRLAAPVLNGAKQSGTEQRAAAVLSHHTAQHCKHKAFFFFFFHRFHVFDPFTFLFTLSWAACPMSLFLSPRLSRMPVMGAGSVGGVTLHAARLALMRSQTEGIWLQVQSRRHQGKLPQNVASYVHFVLSDHQRSLNIVERVAFTHQLGDLGIYVLL